MGLTRKRDLAGAVFVAAVLSYLSIRLIYRYFPPVTLFTGLSLLALAVAEAAWGVSVRRRIRDGRVGVGGGRLHPLSVARSVAIGKASAWVGALALGWWTGVLAYLAPRRADLRVAGADTPGVAVAAVSALLLIVGALWLQHCCKSPDDSNSDTAAVTG